jgi:hypothetical protein
MRRLFRFSYTIALPVMLILVSLLVLTGCLFIPTFNPTVQGTNVAAKVGDANSHRPIRVGFATREQIIAMFGKPQYSDDTGLRIGYAWIVKNGVWVYPFCFTGRDQLGDRGIELDFNDKDVLTSFHIVATDDPGEPIMDLGVRDPSLPRRSPFHEGLPRNNQEVQHNEN